MDSIANEDGNKPLHVVMLPWLAMGHILPFFELAKILAQKGHFVTFVNSPKNIDHMPKTPKSLEPFIELVRLPLPRIEGLPEGAESTMDISSNTTRYLKMAHEGLQDDVTKILKNSSKPDWVFYDITSGWVAPIAKSLNIQCAFYQITPAWSICFFDPPKDKVKSNLTAEDICGPPNWLPFKTTIHLKPYEIIRAFSALKDESGKMPDFDYNQLNSGCDILLLRTSRELEGEWLDYVSYKNVPVVPVGLLPPSLQMRDVEDEENNPDWVKIKTWLGTREPSSVLFIGLGSESRLNQQDLTELALGIELSGLPFFWALKNLKEGTFELPDGFEDRTKDRGTVWKTWSPQRKILADAAIGGCICHCGASSVIEMLNFGHVLVALPDLLDQCLFSRALVERNVAIEIPRSEQDGSLTKESVAQTLRLAIVHEEGSIYRNNAKEMSKVIGSKDLHNHYIEDFIAILHKYRVHSDN